MTFLFLVFFIITCIEDFKLKIKFLSISKYLFIQLIDNQEQIKICCLKKVGSGVHRQHCGWGREVCSLLMVLPTI